MNTLSFPGVRRTYQAKVTMGREDPVPLTGTRALPSYCEAYRGPHCRPNRLTFPSIAFSPVLRQSDRGLHVARICFEQTLAGFQNEENQSQGKQLLSPF